MNFPRWQDAVEAAIASNQLAVTGEVRGGQLIQFNDVCGAQLNILAVEPFSTYAGFESAARAQAHITMLNDVVALAEIADPAGSIISTLTVNLAQGPLLVDEPTLPWQEVGITALALDAQVYDSVEAYQEETGKDVGVIDSPSARAVAEGSGGAAPDAGAEFSARVREATCRTNGLTGQRFIHATVDAAFPFDVCVAYDANVVGDAGVPATGSVIAGRAVMAASIATPSGGGCGGCGGSCGCGG
ncbi:hypothetical protein GCM10027157_05720 [Corynebacterium aquatimens]